MQKYRHELKFLCEEGVLSQIEERVRLVCMRDAHAGKDGIYHIRSIYFDTPEDLCLKDNLDGVDERCKYRIRAYNHSEKLIKLERKGTSHGLKTKESCVITREQCEALLHGRQTVYDRENQELLGYFLAEGSYRLYEPKLAVDYRRTPYVYAAGNVRITFDREIEGASDLELFREDIPTIPVLEPGIQLLEVKYDEYLPGAVAELIGMGAYLSRTSFSKYAMARMAGIS